MARIFWLSGLTKLASWDKTLWLFSNEYKVPIIPPDLAAILSMSAELSCPILLTIGLGTRFASMALLIMSLVIQFTYDPIEEHYYWMMLFSVLIAYGGDKLSADHYIKKLCHKNN
jgi:putative oxidoreductase